MRHLVNVLALILLHLLDKGNVLDSGTNDN